MSSRGKYKVGVKTIQVLNPKQIDIINSNKEKTVFYDRPLTLEIWYPALLENIKEEVVYNQMMGNFSDSKRPLIPFKFKGRASRNVRNLIDLDEPYPLIIVSHGYTGSRLMFTYLTENLASKGYVVVSIDHTDSTFKDANNFNSTLLNRSDDSIVLNQIERMSFDSLSFLYQLVDANNTALIGYSMGGYGALNVAGAGYSEKAVNNFSKISNGNNALEIRKMGNNEYDKSFNLEFKAIVAMAPWGMEYGVWDLDGLSGIKIPTFFIAGSKDDISGYEKGVKAIFDGAINCERYLLTYINARHNIAPNLLQRIFFQLISILMSTYVMQTLYGIKEELTI